MADRTPHRPLADVQLLASVRGEYAFYRWGNVAINVWMAQPTAAMVARLAELTEQSTKLHPEGISSVNWLIDGVGLPTREARAGLRELSLKYDHHLKAVAAVLDGGGFWASAVRAALNGILIATEINFVPRLYSHVDTLVDWLPDAHLRGTGVRLRGAELRAKILAAVQASVPDAAAEHD